jgi:putative addiction module component (TIGR02574 family)
MKSITLDEILQLPVPERIRIVEAIWDSIADTPEALAALELAREALFSDAHPA